MIRRGEQVFRRLCGWVDRLERFLLTVLVAGMVLLASVQILLRNLWHTGLNWAGPLLGMALLWLTLLGALAATGLGRHLSIDLAAALLPRRWAAGVARCTSIFAAGVCILLAWAAGRYVGFQREMDMSMLLGAPVWKFHMIMPVSLWLMAVRFAGRALLPASWRPSPDAEGRGGAS